MSSLQLDFLDEALRRLTTEPGYHPDGWDPAEVRHLRLVAQCAQAAVVASDLQAMRILRLQPHADDPPGTSSVQLSARRRMIIAFKNDGAAATAVFSVFSKEMETSR